MSPDVMALVVVAMLAFAVVLYVAWSNRQRQQQWSSRQPQQQWEPKRDQEDLWRDVRRKLDDQEIASIRRHGDLQRRLDEHHRILKHLARRLS